MAKLLKVVIGVKPAKRMFRVTSLSGEVLDALIESVGEKHLPDDYYTQATRSSDGSYIRLADADDINILSVDTENIIFTKDHYDKDIRINFDDAQKEFQQVWDACQSVLKVRNIRRIGIVGEFRIDPIESNPSLSLLSKLTRFERQGHVAKFSMQFETRHLTTNDKGLPDVKASDFWNCIETYYDSELDADHSNGNQITAMLDVQRYFTPLLNGNVPEEVRKLRKRFEDITHQMKDRLEKLGLMNGAEKT